jgi:hypothetical protein
MGERLKQAARRFEAVGKMNFAAEKARRRVPYSGIGWARSAGPKEPPKEPRPWSIMKVRACVVRGGMMRGEGYWDDFLIAGGGGGDGVEEAITPD